MKFWARLFVRGQAATFSVSHCLVLVAPCLFLAATTLWAGDWPQILGPARNGIAIHEQLNETWPADGPLLVWQREVGSGYAGVAVARGRVVLFHRVADECLAEALDAQTGERIWKTAFPTNYTAAIVNDDGPRCVPLIHQDAVYLVAADGDVHCVALADGQARWTRHARREFEAPEGYFGAGSCPIVEGGALLLNVGARGAGLVAFSLKDGHTLWQTTDEAASYSSPVATTIDGQRHVIFITRYNVVSVDPRDGAERFRFPFGKRGPTVNAANPLVLDDHLFVTSNYGVGAVFAKISNEAATTVWAGDEVLSCHYATCIHKDGVLYGIDGRQDVGAARLRAIEPRKGNVLWTVEDFGTGHLILADGRLLILKTDGELVLATPSPQSFQPLATARLFERTVQALPALSEGLLYGRDTRTLKCFRVGRAP